MKTLHIIAALALHRRMTEADLPDVETTDAASFDPLWQNPLETIRKALLRLGVRGRRAKHWLTSPDPAYAQKNVAGTG